MIFLLNFILSVIICYLFKNNLKKNIIIILISNLLSIILYLIQKDLSCIILDMIFISLLLNLFINKNTIKNKCNKRIKYKYIIVSLFILVISIFSEVYIFNFRHYESLLYKDYKTLKINNIYSLEKLEDNNYQIINNDNYIEIKNINKEINNIYLNIESSDTVKEITMSATDEGNELYYEIGKREIVNNINQSKYIKLNLAGKTKNIKISFKYDNEENKLNVIKINKISINKEKPIYISYIRLSLLFLIIISLYTIRPKSELYNTKCIFDKKQNKIIIIYLILQILFFTSIICLNPLWLKGGKHLTNQREYNTLAEEIVNNKSFEITKYKVSKTLIKMKNPYDMNLRYTLHLNNKEIYMHDFAYYKGKYYVYFGIVPCILFYVPFYIITKKNLYNSILILFMLSGISIMIIKYLKHLIMNHYKNISFMHFILLAIFVINSSGLLYIAKRPDFYSVPILCALFFTLLGIYLWIKSIENDRTNYIKLFLGSLFMALVAGCRPQFVIGSFFCFTIFKDYFIKNIHNKKELIKSILIFSIPYIVVASLLMTYNYIRFDSVFDFGANYNLTSNDMTKRGIKLDRTMLGYFYFLFGSISITPVFPFIEYNLIKTSYMGSTIYEPMYGGILTSNIILFFGLLSYKFKKLIKNNKLYAISILSIIFALIIIFVDVQGAGILPRYINDFSWLLFIPTIIVILSILNSLNNEKNKLIFNYIFIILFVYTIFINLIQIPTDIDYAINIYNPNLYYTIKYYVSFWL